MRLRPYSVTTHQPLRRRARLRALMLAATMLVGLAVGSTTSAPTAAAAGAHRSTIRIDWTIKILINTERQRHHLAPVRMDGHLRLSARRHNLRMAHANTMSHQLPGEPYFGRRITNAGYYWTYAGENIGWNSNMSRAGVVQLERIMYREKAPYNDHRLNILSRHYRNVGVDVFMDEKHHKVWLTTDYGRH